MICKIVIPTTGNAEMLERLLQPWAASSFCWDGIEIVVAQNGEGESCEKELLVKGLPNLSGRLVRIRSFARRFCVIV